MHIARVKSVTVRVALFVSVSGVLAVFLVDGSC